MPLVPLDPAPRRYPEGIALVRRIDGKPKSVPDGTLAQIADWLLGEAVSEPDLLTLFTSLTWRFVAAGLPLDRASLHVGTLHPQLLGFGWNWNRKDGLCDEVKVPLSLWKTETFTRNPLHRVIERGEMFRARLDDPELLGRYPLFRELAAEGYRDYVILPLGGGGYYNAASLATCRPEGFSAEEMEEIKGILRLFALHVERHIALRIAGNVLDTYLGSAAGDKVLQGSIERGSGEAIRAVIWVSDLRGFTDLSDRLSGPEMTAVLNAYFERLVDAVTTEGGEILKFIGDGLLAVFPFGRAQEADVVTEASYRAARQALDALRDLNERPPSPVAAIDGWRPLRTGIALHAGEVFFGNVGGPDRLDFTVIGRAVNEASRVEALCKSLGKEILITAPVAQNLRQPLEALGEHRLRGLGAPVALFSPRAP